MSPLAHAGPSQFSKMSQFMGDSSSSSSDSSDSSASSSESEPEGNCSGFNVVRPELTESFEEGLGSQNSSGFNVVRPELIKLALKIAALKNSEKSLKKAKSKAKG